MKNGITLAAAAAALRGGVTVDAVIFLAVTVKLNPQKSNGCFAEQFADLNKSKVNGVRNAYKHNIGLMGTKQCIITWFVSGLPLVFTNSFPGFFKHSS